MNLKLVSTPEFLEVLQDSAQYFCYFTKYLKYFGLPVLALQN